MVDNIENSTKEKLGYDPLSELLRNGAKELIAQAVEAELETLLGGTILGMQ